VGGDAAALWPTYCATRGFPRKRESTKEENQACIRSRNARPSRRARYEILKATEGSVLKAEAKPKRADKPAKQACWTLVHPGVAQPELYGADGGLGAVGDPELGEDAPHVRLDGANAEE
jgi:hypothetical protein